MPAVDPMVARPTAYVQLAADEADLIRDMAANAANPIGENLVHAAADDLADLLTDAAAQLALVQAADAGKLPSTPEITDRVRAYRQEAVESVEYERGCLEKLLAGDPDYVGVGSTPTETERRQREYIEHKQDRIATCDRLLDRIEHAPDRRDRLAALEIPFAYADDFRNAIVHEIENGTSAVLDALKDLDERGISDDLRAVRNVDWRLAVRLLAQDGALLKQFGEGPDADDDPTVPIEGDAAALAYVCAAMAEKVIAPRLAHQLNYSPIDTAVAARVRDLLDRLTWAVDTSARLTDGEGEDR